MRFRGRARPVSFLDDVAVPPDQLAVVLQRLQSVLQQQNVTWTLDAYAGDGRLRIRPFLDLSDPGDRAKLEPLACRFYEVVLDAGGTIASSQACGLASTQFLRKQYGELVQIFREIKDAFDPLGQLNPGKVIGDDPHLMLQNLKAWHGVPAGPDPPEEKPGFFSWGSGETSAEAFSQAAAASQSEKGGVRAAARDAARGAGDPARLALARPGSDRDSLRVPGMWNLPVARSHDADVPELPRAADRGRLATVHRPI